MWEVRKKSIVVLVHYQREAASIHYLGLITPIFYKLVMALQVYEIKFSNE